VKTPEGNDEDGRVRSMALWGGRLLPDGTTERYAQSESETLLFPVDTGANALWLAVNPPASLKSRRVLHPETALADLRETSRDKMVMTGHLDLVLSEPGYSQICIPVRRLAAKISVEGIRNRLDPAEGHSGLLRIRSLFLLNGVACEGLWFHFNPSEIQGDSLAHPRWWFNCSERGRGGAEPELARLEAPDGPLAKLPSGSSCRMEGCLYTGPNYEYGTDRFTTEPGTPGPWLPRATRLIIETELDGRILYYPVALPEIRSNYWYRLGEIQLLHPGLSHPDGQPEPKMIQFPLQIQEWHEFAVYENF
jgi:hypothetical protein